jgi:hypothetical protein
MLRGIQRDIVETRLIRAFYGINHKTQWNPAVHETPERWKIAEGRKYDLPGHFYVWVQAASELSLLIYFFLLSKRSYSEIEGKYFCENIMTWYVKKVSVACQPILLMFSLNYGEREG